jgi:hypothetical protein
MIEPVARLRITLQEIEPAIWRRIDVPLSSTLMALHDIIQVAMGWTDSHLFEFVVGERVYGEPHPYDAMDERKVYRAKGIRLKQLLDRGVDRFLYVYDFGDDWRHDVVVEQVFEGKPDIDYPAFVDGARRGPPEDVGGASGFMDFVEAALDPAHEEHARMVEWYGKSFDPEDIDERRIRMILGMFADRRRGPLMSHRQGNRPWSR